MISSMRPLAIIALLLACGLGAAAQFAKIAVPFEAVRALYPEAGDATGWLLSGVGLVGMLFGIVAGSLVARIGAVRVLLGGVALGALMSAVQAFGLPFGWLLASRLVEGASHLALVVAIPTLIGTLAAPRWRGFALAAWSTVFGITFAAFAFIVPPLFEPVLVGLAPGGATPAPFDPFAALMIGHAAWFVAVGLALAVALRGLGHLGRDGAATPGGLFMQHRRAYRTIDIAAPGIGWLFYAFAFVALLALLPPFFDPSLRAPVAAAMPLLAVATSLIAVPLLLLVMRATRLVATGFLGSALTIAAMLADLPLEAAALALFAVFGLVQGASFAAVPQRNANETDRALAFGVIAQLGNVGTLTGTPALLAVMAIGGLPALLGTVAALLLAAAVLTWRTG